MTKRLSRRHVGQLLIVVLIGWGVGVLLQRTAPIGQDVDANRNAQAVLQDVRSPSQEVATPTLTLVIFTDYQCPPCKLAHPAMEAAVARDAHVRIVYKDLPIFGARSEQAARVAIASDRQGIYPAVHRHLMSENSGLDEAAFRRAVEGAGGDWTRIRRDMRLHAAEIERQLDLNRRDAFGLGIAGTPAYLAGPVLVSGAIDEAEFAKAFARARQAKGR